MSDRALMEDVRRALRVGYELTLETQTVEDMVVDLVRMVKEARGRADRAETLVADLKEEIESRDASQEVHEEDSAAALLLPPKKPPSTLPSPPTPRWGNGGQWPGGSSRSPAMH